MDPDKRREQNHAAQLRFRERHADELKAAHRVFNILMKQQRSSGDLKVLAAAIRALAGRDQARELGRELLR